MTRPRTHPLRRSLLSLAALGLLPVTLLGAWGVWTTFQAQQQDQQRSILELSRALATAVESELNGTVSALSVASKSPALAKGDLRAFHELMRSEVVLRPEWLSVTLADAQGRLLFRSSVPYGSADIRLSEPLSMAQALRARRPVVGSLAVGHRGEAAFPVRWPVVVDDQLAYVLTAAVKPDRILEVVNKQQVPESWVLSVFDGTGRRVARSKDHGDTLGRPASPSLEKLLAASADAEAGSGVTHTIEGHEMHTGYTRLKSYGWTVVVGAPTAQTWMALGRTLGWYPLGLIGSVAICLVLALRLSARIARGIGAVRDKAVQLGEGKPVQIEPSDIEEVNDMAVALHSASQRLNETTGSLREALSGAQAAAQAKDQFLAILGHELRNPLAPMLTALQLLDMKSDSHTLRERQIMRRQLDHMRRLVDDLLDVSRITRGKLEMRSHPVNLVTVIERSVEAIQPAANQRSQSLRVDWPDGVAVWVQGDDTRLVQAVSNLLTNAVRFGAQAPITLSVNLEQGGQQVCIEVRDEGVGMQPDTLARIFEPFYQAPQASDRTTGGLGLGLAIVRTVVQLHHGTVSAESPGPGQGSRVAIRLPTIAAPVPVSTLAREPEGRRRGLKVLVVDDNVDALETLADLLGVAGHQVEMLAHPRDALTRIPVFQPDVAILDIGMPDMDGYELARAIRSTLPTWTGQLIALTGYGQGADKAKAAAAGFALHLAKPADPNALLEAVQRLAEGPSLKRPLTDTAPSAAA
ncbi:MAG: ATP-binding protein [Pseudomonadota bacterium]